jgi:hypothetical protein
MSERTIGRGEITEDTPRQKPLVVPWSWGEYYAVRYLAGTLRGKLDEVGITALRRGMRELAREAIANHQRQGKPVPQRLALLARGEFMRPDSHRPG